jgi:hypothetical protein
MTKVLTEVAAAFKAWKWIPLPLLGRILQIPIFAKGYFCLAASMQQRPQSILSSSGDFL